MAGKSRVNARRATLAVLEILKTQSSEKKKLHIEDIVTRLKKEPYNIDTNRDTVKSILSDLQEFYLDVDCIKCETTERVLTNGASKNVYTYNYYYEPLFSGEELRLLLDDVLFSKMRTEGQVRSLVEKIKSMAPIDDKYQFEILDEQIPEKQYTLNQEVQENMAMIRDAIRHNNGGETKETWIQFTFNGYGTDRKLHPTGEYTVLPLRICETYQNYYLICYMENTDYLSHYRIDLMTELREISMENNPNDRKDTLRNSLNQKNISEYISSHFYMFYEKDGNTVKTIRLRVEKDKKKPDASMTFLYDAFGRNWSVVPGTETANSVEVQLRCVPSAMRIFVRQYIDRVKIVGPPDVKELVEEGLREDFEK
uniref:helix-turn-helix transcriptional regulator n=1 Tax=Acetatifactor sp. TaxID=1872090 RepID=UPI004056EEDA